MVIGGSTVGNYENGGPCIGENHWGCGGRVSTVKDASVEEIDFNADEEVLSLPSPFRLDRGRVGDKDNVQSGCVHSCASA